MSKCFKHAPVSFCNYGGEVPWFGILVIEWVPKVMQILKWPNCAKQLSVSLGFEKSWDGPFYTMKIFKVQHLVLLWKIGTICMAKVFVMIFTKVLGQRNQFWCKGIWYKEKKAWCFFFGCNFEEKTWPLACLYGKNQLPITQFIIYTNRWEISENACMPLKGLGPLGLRWVLIHKRFWNRLP